MKAYGYLRVSGAGQIDGDGFTRQQEEIERHAKTAGIEIVRYYREEGVRGTTSETDRPAFQEMVSAILKNGVRTIVIEGMDRLAREYRIQESLVIYLASKGITLISARTGEDVTEAMQADPMRKALIQMQGIFSELEKSMLVKKLRAARERVKQKTGKCEGRKSLKEAKPDTWKEIKRLYRKPRLGERRTYKQIAEALNAGGHTTMAGKPFTAGNLQQIIWREQQE
ncbi:recombinase family protein [Pseudodesulfovibrio portus]|uniref:Resolvase/invertase-type recombinase catalytic domain-containing protein n=1 Tax=Pseudodesulfovibrio portus TaxID=231439 RepID=A0ABN6RU64_9BACT|nr:recombinase family protein [Pseudodesulfovibrio portus]BDQ33590.1 hypothetical protein JCM14722_11320 [Pseudodesulfovibrio portus]